MIGCMTQSLGDALPKELERNRRLSEIYAAIGPVGNFARVMIESDIQTAEKAMIAGDTLGMIVAYRKLKGNKE